MSKIIAIFVSFTFTLIILSILSLSHSNLSDNIPITNPARHILSVFSVTNTPKKTLEQAKPILQGTDKQKPHNGNYQLVNENEKHIAQIYDDSLVSVYKILASTTENGKQADSSTSIEEDVFLAHNIDEKNKLLGYPTKNTPDTIDLSNRPISEVKILKSYPIKYPDAAQKLNIPFTVSTKFLISANGTVDTVIIKSRQERFGFTDEVTNSLYKWKFKPTTKNGYPVNIWVTKNFYFLPR